MFEYSGGALGTPCILSTYGAIKCPYCLISSAASNIIVSLSTSDRFWPTEGTSDFDLPAYCCLLLCYVRGPPLVFIAFVSAICPSRDSWESPKNDIFRSYMGCSL